MMLLRYGERPTLSGVITNMLCNILYMKQTVDTSLRNLNEGS